MDDIISLRWSKRALSHLLHELGVHVVKHGVLGGGVGGAELQLGQGVVAGAGLADAQTAGSVHLQLGILLAVLRVLYQILLANVDLRDVGDAAVLNLRRRLTRTSGSGLLGRSLARLGLCGGTDLHGFSRAPSPRV